MRANYYGDRALAGLRVLAEVETHEREKPLSPSDLVAVARDVDFIIADRLTTGPVEVFGVRVVTEQESRIELLSTCQIDLSAGSRRPLLPQHRPSVERSANNSAQGHLRR